MMDTKARREAEETDAQCKSCYRKAGTEPVLIRRDHKGEWVESTIRRCLGERCGATTGGTTEEQLVYVRNTFDYKYFGDYELTPAQMDAVWTAQGLAEHFVKEAAEKDKVIEGLRKVEAAARAYVDAERENTAYIEKCKAEVRSFSSEPMIAALTRFSELKELLSSLAPQT